jgi:hypothetical protein
MRKPITIFTIVLALILTQGKAVQAQSIDLNGNADCEGWNAQAQLTFPAGVFSAGLDYTVILTSRAGEEVARSEWTGQVNRYEEPVMMTMYGDAWGLALDSSYAVSFVFHFLSEEAVLNLELVCGEIGGEPEPVEEACRLSPGFWKNHPEDWPVDTLYIGGTEMDQDQLVQQLRSFARRNPFRLMIRELVAAKLNVANGCDSSINQVIEDADRFLIQHPTTHNFRRTRVPQLRELRHALSVYNKSGCGEQGMERDDFFRNTRDKTVEIEQTSFSSLKAMYR